MPDNTASSKVGSTVLLTVKEVGERLGVTNYVVDRWIRNGDLPATDLNAGKTRNRLMRVREIDLEACRGRLHQRRRRSDESRAAVAEKPYPDFPLYPHSSGHWAKKIRGKTRYFGRIDDGWEAALEKFNREKDDLYAGRIPRWYEGAFTLADLCNHYLDSAALRARAGEMKLDTAADYVRTAAITASVIGRDVPVELLRPADFERLRLHLVQKFAFITVAGHIQRVKTILKWAHDTELVATPIRTGPQFRKPSASLLRREKASKPPRLFSRSEVAWLVGNSRGPLRAMILLGINCGLGNRDCGELEFRHLDLAGGWLTFPRPKTGIARRGKLWPETVAAVEAYLEKRREPRDESLSDRVFLTKQRTAWAQEGRRDSRVSQEMAKLLKAGEMKKEGRGFYSLRHTFRTVADECGDQPAVGYVMGHLDPSIAGVYRGSIADARLEKVAGHVRQWLYSSESRPEAEEIISRWIATVAARAAQVRR